MVIQGEKREGLFREGQIENRLFDFIKEYCLSKNIPIDEQTMSFVLYCNELVTNTFTVKDENIQGISIYGVEKKKIMHHLFVKNENKEFIEIENTKVPVYYETINSINFYLENYVFEESQNRSYICIGGLFEAEVNKNKKNYKRAPLDRFEIKSTKKDQVGGHTFYCGNPCLMTIPHAACYKEDDVPSGCVENPCVSRSAQSTLLEKNYIENLFFNMNLMYTFRDDFLYNSIKGVEYIDNYYFLSEEYQKKINLSLALNTALFFKDFNSAMEAFVHPENHLSEIIFTDELSNSLFDLLNAYETITTSTEGKAILASIRTDIDSYKNKPLQDILSMID